MELQGFCEPEFSDVREEFHTLWQDIEVGAALCIYVNGKAVIDLWGGYKDAEQVDAWQHNTLVNIYSATKGIIAIAVAQLVEQGKLDYARPVSHYWPEFGAENKYNITVDELISHQAGLIGFRPEIQTEDLYDWQKMVFNLASQKPAWQPGTAFGYHAITWGYLVGELIRRVTGMTPGSYIHQYISQPINANIYLGLSATELARCADLIGPNRARRTLTRSEPTASGQLETRDPVITPFKHASSRSFRQAEIPATNGHASGNGLAHCYNAVLTGDMMTAETKALATTELTNGEIDLVQGQAIRRARGFILNCDACYMGPSERAFGHSGTGGSTAFADPDNGVAFAYVTNQLHVDGRVRSRRLIDSFYQSIVNKHD